MKYFFHGFFKGYTTPEDGKVIDAIGCFEVLEWEILETGIKVKAASDNPRGYWMFNPFGFGNRFYIVENHGQCQEPNGDIIWRNENGAFGDEKAA